ncbi:type II toxin-antitoxin system death-on-curing family toxin [Paenibacillus wenxiniae]|uniref:Type II toxin-antitoxin system death-on-curing family toxin n=1 Tax=Paenibacillus wenxiniae TaxID=1636843 RepID=A0ABW4RJF3_9BACL
MLEQYGGLQGIKDSSRLHFIAEQPFQESFGVELYPGLSLKAAVYLVSIARAHAFFDANKRTAAFACDTFLYLNGYHLSMSKDEYYNLVLDSAQGHMSFEEVATLIERYLIPLHT